jgi:hypothetical protein
MADQKQERKPGKKINKGLKIDKLELSKETVKDLTDTEAERAEGGAAAARCSKCTDVISGC